MIRRLLYHRTTIALLGILSLAFGLRVWGLGWGMPFAFHADEDNYLPGAITMLVKGDLNPHYFRNPPLLTYAVLTELLAYMGLGQLLGGPRSVEEIGLQMLQSPAPLYLIARMNGALTGTATVLVTYLAAKRLFDTRTGLAGALLLAVAFLHVRDSHYAVNDVPATFLLMVSFYFATRIFSPFPPPLPPRGRQGIEPDLTPQPPLRRGEGEPGYSLSPWERVGVRAYSVVTQVPPHPDPLPEGEGTDLTPLPASGRGARGVRSSSSPLPPCEGEGGRKGVTSSSTPFLLSGFFLGLAVATKYNVGIGAVAILAAHLLRCKTLGWSWHWRDHLPLVAAGAVALLTFLLANPFALLDYSTFLQQFVGQYAWTSDPYDTSDLSMGGVILRALSVGTSPWMLAAFLLGLALLLIRQPGKALLVGSFPLAYLAFFLLGSSLFYARFALPVVPFVALLAAYAAVRIAQGVPLPGWRPIVAGAILILLAVPPLVVDLKHNSLLRTEDTRVQLARWMEDNVPPGSKLAIEGYSLVDFWGRRLGFKKLEYSWQVNSSLRARPLEDYRRDGIDYLVASSYVYGRYALDSQAHDEAIDYYRQLERELPLVAVLHPTTEGRELPFVMDDEITPIWTVMERNRPGPTLRVYRVGKPQRYGVQWLDASIPQEMAAGQKLSVPIALRNSGNIPWPSDGYTPVRIACRWFDSSGQELPGHDQRASLPHTVEPNGEARLRIDLAAPSFTGTYTLKLELVQENFAWLSDKGAEAKEFKVSVR